MTFVSDNSYCPQLLVAHIATGEISHLQGKSLYFWEVHGSHSPMFVTRSWFSATLYGRIGWFWTRGAMGTKWLRHTHANTDTDHTAHTTGCTYTCL